MHEVPFLKDLGLILITAGFTSLIFKKLKQPVVIGYIVAGFLIGPNLQSFYTFSSESIQTWAEIGIIFLLFSLGLEFSFKKLMKTGMASGVAASVEIPILFLSGYLFASWMGWDFLHKVFLGGMLSISSTAIIFRSFVDLNLSARAFSQFVFGILIFEDIVAILLLVLLPTVAASKAFVGPDFLFVLVKMMGFIILWFVLGIFILPSLLRKIKVLADEELYVLLSLGLCFSMVALSVYLGYSAALGAFVMGSLLAETEEKERIIKVFEPIRNLFAAIFFVSIGMLIAPAILVDYALVILVLSLIVLLGKTIGIFLGAVLAGQSLASATLSASSMAQIGEFSFILAKLGVSKELIREEVFPIIVAVSLITTFITPYWMRMGIKASTSINEWLPKRAQKVLAKYDEFIYWLSFQQKWIKPLQRLALQMVIYSVLVFSLFFLSRYIQSSLGLPFYIGLALALVTSAPFLWAMLFKEVGKLQPALKKILFAFRILYSSLFLLILVSLFFLPTKGFVLLFLLLGLIAFFKYSKKLSQYYSWYEDRFLSNYQGPTLDVAPQLAPWDIHISEFLIQPLSPIVGKSIGELKVREQYGLTIASIQRGKLHIFAPSQKEIFYPFDQISLIGGDEEILEFQNALLLEAEILETKEEERLVKVSLEEDLEETPIREAKIRDRYDGIIVGIERAKERILNPSPNLKLKKGDLLWLLTQTRK